MNIATRQNHVAPAAIPAARTGAGHFTMLEQRVLRLAASGSERPSTTVEPAWRHAARKIGNAVMAHRGGHELADPRLEALRSYAASVRLGRAEGLAVFYAAGYSASQAAEVKRIVGGAMRNADRGPARRDRMMYASGLSIGLASIVGFVAMTGTLLAGL